MRSPTKIWVISPSGNKDRSHDEKLKAVTELFDRTGLAYKVPDDILREQWNKLMLNTGVNQVTAVYGAPYSLIQKEGEARTMMIEAMREVLRVADTQDIDLTEADIDYWLELLATLNPEGHTSMCQDVLAGRPTEVDLFAGTMLKIAKKEGFSLPVNTFLYEKLKELEGYQEYAYKRGVFTRPFLNYLYAMVPYVIQEDELVQVLQCMKDWFAR